MKLLSIVIPCYKVEEYLNKCVDSVLNALKNHEDAYEIILVNDGSPDRCGEICDEYANQYEHIKVIHKENGGLSDARNFGIKESSGEYIAFIDSDDWVDKSMIELLKIIEDNNGIDLIQVGFCSVNEKDEQFEISPPPNIGTFKIQEDSFHINAFCFIAAWLKIIKRSVLIDNDLYFAKGMLHEDEDWHIRVLISIKNTINVDLTYYKYLKNREDSITGIEKQKNIDDALTIFANNFDLIQKSDISSKSKKFLLRYTCCSIFYVIYARLSKISNNKTLALYFRKYKKFLKYKYTKSKKIIIVRTWYRLGIHSFLG